MFADSNVIAASQLNIHTYDKSNEIEFERSKKKNHYDFYYDYSFLLSS